MRESSAVKLFLHHGTSGGVRHRRTWLTCLRKDEQMKKLLFGALAALTLGGLSTSPASADPPRHSHPTYGGYYSDPYYAGSSYYGDRSRGSYRDRGHERHDAVDHGSRSRYGYGRDGYGRDGYYGSDADRHNDHPAERKKRTHSGRHVIDRKHGHHR